MPDGHRRQNLQAAARATFTDDFEGRVLPFDMQAAVAYADIFATCRRAGRATATVDLMVAAVANARGASVVARNVAGFEGCGVAVVDPWNVQAMPAV